MENGNGSYLSKLFRSFCDFLRRCLCSLLSFGPMPTHIAFIMDGNRRFARYNKMKQGTGHQFGFMALMSVLQYCYEMGVKYVTVYAFSIDNFNRKPDEVQYIMDLMLEKIEVLLNEESIVKRYGIRVRFLGNLRLLHEPVRIAAERAMAATAENDRAVLSICIAYSSTDEIVHAVQESYDEKRAKILRQNLNDDSVDLRISPADLERHMYTAGCPDPDILIRTSGETRLSNFLLWQTSFCYLYAPKALWPDISFRHLVWAIVNYQQVWAYLDKNNRLLWNENYQNGSDTVKPFI